MMKKIKSTIISLKSSLGPKISSNKSKIAGTLATVPLIAAGTMSGTCAAACPYGLVNDPFPGQCGHYIDLDGDGICDLSQTATASFTSTSQSESQTTDAQNSLSNDGGYGVQAGNSDYLNATTAPDPGSGSLDSVSSSADGMNYHVLPITLLLVGSYLFTYYLFKKGILNRQKHTRIWNLLLVAGYLGTGVTGVLLTLMINMGISTIYNPVITFWHAELSILMVIGTLIHIHIHKKPIKRMFKALFGFNSVRNRDIQRNISDNSK